MLQRTIFFIVVVAYKSVKFTLSNFLMFVWFQPILYYQLINLRKDVASVEISLLVCVFLANLLFGGFFVIANTLAIRYNMIKQIKEKLSDYIFYKYSISDYLKTETLQNTEELSLQKAAAKFYGSRLYKFEKDTVIYVIKRNSVDTPLVGQFFAYTIPFLKSYIFLRDEPDRIKTIGKFYLFHEIGHTLATPLLLKNGFALANKSLYLLTVWIMLTIEYNTNTILCLALLILNIIFLEKEISRRRHRYKLADEIEADHYALNMLSTEEKESLKEKLSNKTFPSDDSSMTDEENWLRQKVFKKNLFATSETATTISNEISIFRTPLELFPIVIIVALLGLNRRESTHEWISNTAIYIYTPLLILIILLTYSILSDKLDIRKIIDNDGKIIDM